MKKILVFLIKCYKKWISPLLPSACRFEPTCSIYAMQAIERFGVIRGLLLAIWRILRCNPLCKSGYDPVPERGFRNPKVSVGEESSFKEKQNNSEKEN